MLSWRYHKLSTSNWSVEGFVPGRTGRQATVIFLRMLLAVSFSAMLSLTHNVTYTLFIRVEQHQQRFQDHFERVNIFSILGQGSNEPTESA
jgi:hypothetical protein